MSRKLNWGKLITVLCTIMLTLTVVGPSVSAATKQTTAEENSDTKRLEYEELNKIINETANEIKSEAPKVNVANEQPTMHTMAAGSLAVKLAKLFGKSYVKSKLPKKIYKAFPKSLKDNVSEAKWVGIWNTYILMGPLDEVKNSVANALKPYVWDWVATTCGYIAQGIVYAVI
ncbi:hypothetical protein SAMN05421503_2798 [Terribacillus aidingensis]|uniref:Antimicrobial peptide, SdpC family n=1 Tax=Terribacillus aidingensis TaxID=586416 RepID=A0A285P2F0_9BACI|nr:hypothetical protein [Terribacillus aidingensis]SNZ15919.1 hypothetical protein SAMN05421503_2798 [Terribacillus aidingensis]